MARRPQKRVRSESPEPELGKRRRSGRIEALRSASQIGRVDGGSEDGSTRGDGSSMAASSQGLRSRIPSANGASISSQQSSHATSETRSTVNSRPNIPIMNPIVRVQAHSQYIPTTYPTLSNSPSSQYTTESEGSYDDSANRQVLLINAQEDFMAALRMYRNTSTVLRRTLEEGMRMMLSNARTPNAGHGIVQHVRDAGGVNPRIPWDADTVMAGVHAHCLPGMHRHLQGTVRRIRQRQRAGRTRAGQIFSGNLRAPATVPVNAAALNSLQATSNTNCQSGTSAVGQQIRLNNLFRREDGLYVITMPGSRDIIAVAADATVFYKRHNGDTFRIPPHMVSYLLAKLWANNRSIQNIPSAHQLAEIDETYREVEEVIEDIGEEATVTKPLRKDEYPPGTFNLIDALIRHPAILASLLKYLSASTLVTLYSKSKLFQYLFNSDYERYIMANLRYHMPDERIFPWRFFAKLCIYDPVRRNDPRDSDHTKIIPGLKYLSMVHYHLEVANEIKDLLNRQVKGIPEACIEAMLKMSFVMILPSNASRIGIMHNKSYWTDSDLLHAWLFIIKLDMALNSGALVQKVADRRQLRQRLFTYKDLSAIRNVLKMKLDGAASRDQRKDQEDGASAWLGRLRTGFREKELYSGEKLLRPDQLIVQEGYARALNLWEYNMGFMLHGW